jgi:hypothetical protein
MSRQARNAVIAVLVWVLFAALVLVGAGRTKPTVAAAVLLLSGATLAIALWRAFVGRGWTR